MLNFKIFLIFCVFTSVFSADILAVIPTPAFSHQQVFQGIWRELSKRHNVTLITTDPINDRSLVNLTEMDMHDSYKILQLIYRQLPVGSSLEILYGFDQTRLSIMDFQLSNKKFQSIVKNGNFDVVIVEAFFMELVTLADLYGCPKILISSYEVPLMLHSYMGNPINPVGHTDIALPYVTNKKTFAERGVSVFYYLFNFVYKSWNYIPKNYKIIKKYFGNKIKSPLEVLNNIDLVLVNSNPVINEVRSYGANTVPIGPGLHINPKKPLPKDLQEYLDSATEGYIYFSLGTNSKSMFMGEEKIKIIMEALGELPFKVLWKFEVEDVLTPPKNIKLIKWAPQQDILRHPNIKLFITQGGLQSLEESIINKVPMAMMPMYGDQEANAKRMQYRGLAKIIPHKPLPDKEEFKKIVMEVITDPSYKEKVTKAAELLLDQPMPAVDKAVWWIEYVIRHKGAKHLRNPVVDIPFYQYYCLDIIGAIFAFFYAVIKLVKLTIWGLKRIFIKSEKSKKE